VWVCDIIRGVAEKGYTCIHSTDQAQKKETQLIFAARNAGLSL